MRRVARPRSLSSSPILRSHQSLAAGEGRGLWKDPSVEQIEIDIARAQDQGGPVSPDLWLFPHGGGEPGGPRAFREVMRIGPVGPDRRGHFIVADLHDAGSTLA